jgi:hypothetical protein
MRLDPRILIPAALAAGALAIPAVSAGDPPATGNCPDGFMLVPLGPVFADKDHNDNNAVCIKPTNPNPVTDDNCADPCMKDPVTGLTYYVYDDVL